MEYVFHERKAGQAAAYLLRKLGGESSPIVLNQLLYLADRRAMCSDGFPITGDRLMASPLGMILGRVYELNLPKQWPPAEAWREYVTAPDECGLIHPADDSNTLPDEFAFRLEPFQPSDALPARTLHVGGYCPVPIAGERSSLRNDCFQCVLNIAVPT